MKCSETFARRNEIGRGQMNLKHWLAGTLSMPTPGHFCCILIPSKLVRFILVI